MTDLTAERNLTLMSIRLLAAQRVVEVIEDDESPDCGCELCLALAAFRRLVPKEAHDDL